MVTRPQSYRTSTVNTEGGARVTEDVRISRLSTNWRSESCPSLALGLADKMKTPETFELIWSNVREKELHHLQFLVTSKKD